MKIYKIAQEKDEFLSWFDTSTDDIREKLQHRVVSPPKSRKETLILYRGFNHLPPSSRDITILSPKNSEQGTLWFTHKLVSRNIDPIEYAESHGKYLLTYPLNVIKHYQAVSYDNSDEQHETIPEEILEKTDNVENCRFYMGYELPEGWFFSYKHEKFIICETEIEVSFSSQIKVTHNENI